MTDSIEIQQAYFSGSMEISIEPDVFGALIQEFKEHYSLIKGDAEGQGAFNPATSVGLFVGVSTFEDERIPEVPFAVDDAVDLAHLFALELRLVAPENTVLLLTGEPRKAKSIERLEHLVQDGVRRRSARQRDIYQYLGELSRAASTQGIMFVSVATHGISDQGGDFLLATDSLMERMLRTGVAVDELFDDVARSRAERRLVLLDACRERLSPNTRGITDSTMSQSFAAAIARAEGLVVLSGSTAGGFAYDDPVRKNGVFTSAVLDGLRGDAKAGPEGWITVRTLADFAQQRVVEWVQHNRPDHARRSLGIGRRVEASAEFLPLAPHPEVLQKRSLYCARREKALARVKENQGNILTGALWDQIATWLPTDPSKEAERLLEEIEALDGSERAQRSLRDFLRELMPATYHASGNSEREVRQGKAQGNALKRVTEPTRKTSAIEKYFLRFMIAVLFILIIAILLSALWTAIEVPGNDPVPRKSSQGNVIEGKSAQGRVIDETGKGLAGITVYNDNGQKWAVTDSDGYFPLAVFTRAKEDKFELQAALPGKNTKKILCSLNEECIFLLNVN